MTQPAEHDERYHRQADLLQRDGLARRRVAIAGCGAVGRQLCLQLAAAGQEKAVVFDHDTIETVNLGPQGWAEADIGQSKVRVLSRDIEAQYGKRVPNWLWCNCRFPLALPEQVDAIFLCVDSITTRRNIFEAHAPGLRSRGGALFDARVAGEIMRIVCCCNSEDWDYYPRTLFAEEEAMQVSCTAKMTIHLASIAAGLLMQQYALWIRGMHTVPAMIRDLQCNWLAMEMFPTPASHTED